MIWKGVRGLGRWLKVSERGSVVTGSWRRLGVQEGLGGSWRGFGGPLSFVNFICLFEGVRIELETYLF